MNPPIGLGLIFALIGAFVVASGLLARHTDFGSRMAAHDGRHEFRSLEGLRGLLAVLVFVCHIPLFCAPAEAGGKPVSVIYDNLGSIAVFWFFMMTGFLFWLRIVRNPHSVRTVPFLKKRFRRLFPAYAVSATVTVGTALWYSGPITASATKLMAEIAPWYGFRIFGLPDINGLKASVINAPYWSLRYEWAFYALMPVFAFAGRRLAGRFAILATITLILLLFGSEKVPGKIFGFVGGMLVAELIATGKTRILRDGRIGFVVTAATLALLFTVSTQSSYAMYTAQILYLTPLFLLFAADNAFFSPFRTAPMRFLGAISFDVYIFHNIVLYWFFYGRAACPPETFLWKIAACVAVILTITIPVHLYVERPFMETGKKPAG